MRTTPMSRVNPAAMKGYGDCDPPECEGYAGVCVECDGDMEADGMEARCTSCGHTEEPDYEAMAGGEW